MKLKLIYLGKFKGVPYTVQRPTTADLKEFRAFAVEGLSISASTDVDIRDYGDFVELAYIPSTRPYAVTRHYFENLYEALDALEQTYG